MLVYLNRSAIINTVRKVISDRNESGGLVTTCEYKHVMYRRVREQCRLLIITFFASNRLSFVTHNLHFQFHVVSFINKKKKKIHAVSVNPSLWQSVQCRNESFHFFWQLCSKFNHTFSGQCRVETSVYNPQNTSIYL